LRYICQVVIALIVSAIAGCSSAPETAEKKENSPLETIILDDAYVKKDSKKEAYKHYESGEAYSQLKAFELALEQYWKAFELDKSTIYLNRLGITSLQLKRVGDARYFFEEAQRREPERLEHIANVAFIDLLQGRYESAEKKYRQIISQCPNDMMINYNLAHSILLVALSGLNLRENLESMKSKLSDLQREKLREARRFFENAESLPVSKEYGIFGDDNQFKQNASTFRRRIDYLLAK
jgi:tetratricopeptide (TPR) repeat protein